MHSTSSNSHHRPLAFIATLSLGGALISGWQTSQFFAMRSGFGSMKSICDLNASFDCTAIEMSRFAELIPGVPLSQFALAGYLLIFTLAVLGYFQFFPSNLKKVFTLFSAISVVFSLIYFWIMMGQIGKWCLFCLILDAINLALLAVSLKMKRTLDPKGSPETFPFKPIGIAGLAVLVIALLIGKAVDPQAQAKKEDLNDLVESVMNTAPVAITVPQDSPVVGKSDAPITIVKFSDYQCPSCKVGAMGIHPLMKRYADQVKFVFINYPLDMTCNPEVKRKMHEFACEAAAVAICATVQGKFLETYETLFENQSRFSDGKIADLLSSVPGIDLAQLKSCIALPSTQDKIRSDVALGAQLKIEATPTFYINGKKVEGGLPTSLWIEVIERLLKK